MSIASAPVYAAENGKLVLEASFVHGGKLTTEIEMTRLLREDHLVWKNGIPGWSVQTWTRSCRLPDQMYDLVKLSHLSDLTLSHMWFGYEELDEHLQKWFEMELQGQQGY